MTAYMVLRILFYICTAYSVGYAVLWLGVTIWAAIYTAMGGL